MSYLAAGVIAFGMFLLYDLNSFTWKNRILHTFFLIGNVILLASTAACFVTLIRAYGAPVWRIVIFGALAVSQAALLIYTLFFALPFGRRKSIDKVIALLLDYLKENGRPMSSYRFTIGFGYDREEAVLFKEQVLAALRTGGYEMEDAWINQIGATIAVHTGPYPLGIGIIRRHKKERQGE